MQVYQQAVAAHQHGNLPEAEQLLRQVLEREPNHADALGLLGAVRGKLGDADTAVSMLERSLELAPQNATWRLALAALQRQAGRNVEALEHAESALDTNPDLLDAVILQANCLRDLDRTDDAVDRLRRFAESHPDEPRAIHMLGVLLLSVGRQDEALHWLGRVLSLQPDHAQVHSAIAQALLEKGLPEQALVHVQRASELMPGNVDLHIRAGGLLNILERYDEAEREFAQAVNLDPSNVRYLTALARQLRTSRKIEQSKEMYRRAIAVAPRATEPRTELASILERQHLHEEAAKEARQVLEINPADDRAHVVLASIDRSAGDLDSARTRLETFLQDHGDSSRIGAVLVELGHVLDALGEYDRAFEAVTRGQRLLADEPIARQYSMRSDPDLIASVHRWLDEGSFRDWPTTSPDDGLPSPVFFVGYPRSGTTLTERILDAHPAIYASDERGMMARSLRALYSWKPMDRPFPLGLNGLDEREIMRVRREYWMVAESLLELSPTSGMLLVDKLPLNIMKLAFVRRFFPDAKVLVAIRDPRDCCISCLFQNFRPNTSMVHYFELGTTARHYAAVMNLWLRQRAALGLDWMESRYENIVVNYESAARRLIRFLGVPWHEEILEYQKHAARRYVSTPSYVAVTQPIYRKSTERWRRYEKQLEPVMPILEPLIRSFGYDHASANAVSPHSADPNSSKP